LTALLRSRDRVNRTKRRPLKAETKIALAVAGTGFGIAVALVAYAFYAVSRGLQANDLFLVVCPACIGLMALNTSGFWDNILGALAIATLNMFVYLLVTAILRAIFGWFPPRNSI